jgi:hypothetical protein
MTKALFYRSCVCQALTRNNEGRCRITHILLLNQGCWLEGC